MRTEQAISSKAVNGREVSRGLSHRLRDVAGAQAVRVIERPDSLIDEHAHDWPVLSLYVMGSCTRYFGDQEIEISGPCAVLHPRGEFHSSRTGVPGLEQIDIEFEPSWFPHPRACGFEVAQHWRGGRIGAAVSRLSTLWASGAVTEGELRNATSAFIQLAQASEPPREPAWLRRVLERIDCDPPPNAETLGRELELHPAWLSQSYRSVIGEGLQQTLMRKRVERASLLLRNSDQPAAQIAVETGFCDQSHMIRRFRKLLGRTPYQVRTEGGANLAALPPVPAVESANSPC